MLDGREERAGEEQAGRRDRRPSRGRGRARRRDPRRDRCVVDVLSDRALSLRGVRAAGDRNALARRSQVARSAIRSVLIRSVAGEQVTDAATTSLLRLRWIPLWPRGDSRCSVRSIGPTARDAMRFPRHRQGTRPLRPISARVNGARSPDDEHRLARRHDGGRLGAAHRLRAAPHRPPREGAGVAARLRRSARCCCSTRTTSATSRARTSASGRATRARAACCCRARATRCCGTSARPPSTTSCTRRGCPSRAGRPASPRCAARCRARPACRTRSPARIHRELAERGLAGEPLGIDLTDMETLYSLQRQGIETADAQPVMMRARAIKTPDEIALLEHAAAIVDAVYEEIYRMLRPGVREHEIVAVAMQLLFELGSEQVEAINAVSGDRCNPHPHVFSRPPAAPRRPGLLRRHPLVHGLPHLLLPHVQRRRRHAVADRRLQAVPRVARHRRSSSSGPA